MGLNDNKEVESGRFRCHSDVEDNNNEVRSEMFLRFPFWEESETIMHRRGNADWRLVSFGYTNAVQQTVLLSTTRNIFPLCYTSGWTRLARAQLHLSKLRLLPVLFHMSLILLGLATIQSLVFLLARSRNAREQAQPNSTFQTLVHVTSAIIPSVKASNTLSLHAKAREEISLFPPSAMASMRVRATVGNEDVTQ